MRQCLKRCPVQETSTNWTHTGCRLVAAIESGLESEKTADSEESGALLYSLSRCNQDS